MPSYFCRKEVAGQKKPADIEESTSEHLALQISIQTTIEIFDLLDNLQFREGNTNRYLLSRLERRETSVRTGTTSKGITQPTLQESCTEITRGNISVTQVIVAAYDGFYTRKN